MKQSIICSILTIMILTSCGTTHLITCNSDVDIYINGRFKGKGEATVPRTGPPRKIHVDAKYNGQKVGSADVHREVKFITCLVGLYTYGVGFFLTWKFPETVVIPIKDIREKRGFDDNESIWNLPPGDWKKSR